MELLAPVGSKESFITAIRAGADAVYMGVPDFNARIAASNINLFDLQVLTDYAHSKKVKVYLAFNTLIKHEEISDAVKRIAHAEKIRPDAVIVQDLGMAGIIHKYFPDMELHASTQLAVHNRPGVDFLARNGFKRAILARELTFPELKIIANGSPIGVEVFTHGALCFCLSGMCLFSSFIGGLSGNRGRCTQPCRRLWQNGKKRGYIFSPRDLELAEYVGKLKSIGVTSLKIEGRMRSSEYVYRTVKAYRMLIDAKDGEFELALKEAKAILSEDMARAKTACLFSGRDENMFQPGKAQCLGNLIGSVTGVAGGNLTVELESGAEMIEGDRLRISDPATDTTAAFKVKEFSKEGRKYVIPFSKAGDFRVGDPVFKTVDTACDQKDIEKDIDSIYENYKKENRRSYDGEPLPSQGYTALISNRWKDLKNASLPAAGDDTLWVRYNDALWANLLPKAGAKLRHVFYLTKDNLHESAKFQGAAAENLTAELPPFIGQRDIAVFQQCVDKLTAAGVNKWVLNNVSHFGLLKDMECELTAGQFLYTWNAYTAAFLSGLGVKYFTASWEDDFLNIRKMCAPGLGRYMLVYLYGFPPLVRSRLITAEMLEDASVNDCSAVAAQKDDDAKQSFRPVFESGLALLLPENAVGIFTARRKFRECGISNYGIDLSFVKPDKKRWDSVFSCYNSEENMPGFVKFNFKRLIK